MSNDTAIESLQEKIDDLNQQAWDVRVTDLPKSFELSEESVKLARSINYPKGLAEGLRSLGFSYVRLSKNDEAAPLLKESFSLFQSLNDLKGQAVIYEYLGIIERNWGNLGASLDLLLKANELVLQIGSQEIEITCSYQLGVTYKHLGDHENALDYLYKTLSLAKKMNFTLMEAYATNIIGSIYFDNGNYNQALDCYQQGLPIRKQSHDKWGEAGSLDNIGFTYLKLNDLDKAIDYCKQSLAICQATGDKKGEANALLHLGEIYEQAGDIKQAADFSNASLKIRKERGDKRGETEVLLFLAELYKNRSDVEDHQIFEWLSNALKIADEVKAQDLLSKTHYNLHEYYQQKGNFKESLVQLEAHFQIEKELHKNSINQKIANLEISHKAEVVSQRNKELTELNEKIEKANEELKIEASLEKIRSRSLAMHKSDELKEVITLVFEKLKELEVVFEDAGIYLFTEGKKDSVLWVAAPDHLSTPILVNIPYSEKIFEESEIFRDYWMAKEKGENTYNKTYSYDDKNRHFDYLEKNNESEKVPENVREYQRKAPGYTVTLIAEKHSALVIDSWTGQTISIKEFNILKRVARVFEQAYTRFLDLQKAEAQTRESQIQLALERVRARTMAMQRSDELADVAQLLFQQVKDLGIEAWTTGFNIWQPDNNAYIDWITGPTGNFLEPYTVQLTVHPTFRAVREARLRGDDFFVSYLEGDQIKETYEFLSSFGDKGQFQKILDSGIQFPAQQYNHFVFGAQVSLMFITYEPYPEAHDIFKRFGKVFEQTYTRFLDLQKAEAQAREAQIELALERVRARTMAMQKSDELREAVLVIYEQLQQLNFESRACNIIIIDKESGSAQYWVSGFSQEIFPESYTVPYLDHPYQDMLLKPWKQGNKYVVYEYTGKMKQSFDEIFFTKTEFKNVPEDAKKVMIGLVSVTLSTAFISYGALQALGAEPLSEEKANILKRFAKVFEQTYTRFLDLQKAEAQVREAQIEAGLERVRAKTMAMHKSDEVTGIAVSLNEELLRLGFARGGSTIIIINRETGDTEQWTGFSEDKTLRSCFVPYLKHPCHDGLLNSWKKGEKFFVYTLQGDEKKALDDHYFATGYKIIPENDKKWMRELESVTFSHAFMKYGAIHWAYDHLSEEQLQILQRFSKVFEQSYTRFLDLQKAEAQARESQVEAALEKIRSRSLAMHHSRELKEVIAITFEKLNELNVLLGTVAIQLFDKKSMHSVLWVGNTIQDPQMVDLPYDKQMMVEDTLVKDSWQAMIDGVDIINKEYSVEQKNKYFNFLFFKNSLTQIPEQAREVLRQMQSHIACLFVEKNSAFLVDSWAGQFFPKENLHVLKRAAKVFEQAYIRFLDLQKAEAQAREAQIEAALEKVRSRTLAMQKSDELAETAAEVFRQLIGLGIEPNRLYIGIVKEETGDMEMWATDEDGTQVGKRFMFNKNENASVLKLYDGWKTQKKSVIVDMQGKELEDYFHYLNNVMHIPFKGGLTQKRRVQSVAYFSKGFIGMASPDGQGDETIQLLERFAAVFNLTFTRFNDLKIAEAHAVQAREDLVKLQTEKKRAEDALSELQITQKQLIQAEKMASLGELTAGIAHEIQNPLNFVNNFSDVNKELLIEMKEEIEKGNIDEVKTIANDIISNEEKINHHGKRADAIVKGMLQHSRSSSGVKEPTDINELADEYLRLAYHGLRAKDKSFNATMKTDFDEAIGKVNVIPQEIGRVFLNLITNAFYVVAEKKKQLANGYEPTVTVTTKKESNKVVVSVKDNGNGIPQKVLDKIFQPFFTTKPTGQGTGLGLSLSYDIVKAHSGEIKVKTKDGEGSEFVIQLPIDQ